MSRRTRSLQSRTNEIQRINASSDDTLEGSGDPAKTKTSVQSEIASMKVFLRQYTTDELRFDLNRIAVGVKWWREVIRCENTGRK